jgi:CHAD domain-containing protein
VGFRLKSGQAISSEVRRIVLRQLDLATSELKSIGDPESDEAIHDARRRVKKIRAVIRLVRPVLDKTYRAGVDPDLRRVSKMLAPVADGQGVVETLNVLARRYRRALPRKAVAALRADLIEREKRIDAKADAQHVLQKATRALRAQRKQIKAWKLTAEGFHAIAPGLKESVRRARHAMTAAWTDPTPRHFHSWRRYVKDHWFHVRLLEAHCGNHLIPIQRRLEALDGLLGEYHNLVLLREVLLDDSALAPLDRAYCLRVVARYQRALRQQAQILGVRTYSEKPRRFVRRVKRLWRTANASEAADRSARDERR